MEKFDRDQALRLATQIFTKARLAGVLDKWNGRKGGFILVFHEISEAQLAKHLTQLSRSYTFVSLSEFTGRLADGKSTSGLAVITFDDGYGAVIESAARLARLHGWPMTFFLPTRYLDTREPNWYQELGPLLQRATRERLTLNGLNLSLHDPASRATALNTLDRRFKSLTSIEEINNLLRKLRYALLGSEEQPADLLMSEPISWERVRELSTREELSFEAHSVNHLALSRLSEKEMREEMEQCLMRIEEVTGRKVQHFCYPYGDPCDIGELAPRLARSLFRSATTMLRGRCRRNSDLALLPRIPLYERDSEQMVAFKVCLAS